MKENKLRVLVIENDGTDTNFILLTALKNIFQKQLPKMPREYVTRLIYDRRHRSLLIVKQDQDRKEKGMDTDKTQEDSSMEQNQETELKQDIIDALKLSVVGGITYRPFLERGFIEIVFCAISAAS